MTSGLPDCALLVMDLWLVNCWTELLTLLLVQELLLLHTLHACLILPLDSGSLTIMVGIQGHMGGGTSFRYKGPRP